jgi:hypothetical protein
VAVVWGALELRYWLQRRAINKPDGQSLSSGSWVTVSGAIHDYLPPAINARIAGAQSRVRRQRKGLEEAQHDADLAAGALEAGETVFEAESALLSEEIELKDAMMAACKKLTLGLSSRTFSAKGMPLTDGKAGEEVAIPSEFWRFLTLDWTTDAANGGGHQYVGVRINYQPGRWSRR